MKKLNRIEDEKFKQYVNNFLLSIISDYLDLDEAKHKKNIIRIVKRIMRKG
jgi:hypothetical protein